MSGVDRSGSFFARNKVAISVAAVAGISAGAYLYYNAVQNQQAGGSDGSSNGNSSSAASGSTNESSKKKKSKKKKNGSAGTEGEVSAKSSSAAKLYPVANGVPAITEEDIAKLSEKEKDEWAAALKEDGNQKFKANEYKEAIEYYSAALQLKIDPVFFSNRSACYAALNDHENVIKDTTEAIKLKPDYTKCVLRRATSYEILENYTDAMYDLTALTIYGGFNNKSVEQLLERVLKKHSIKIVEENLKNRIPELPSAATICSFFGAFVEESTPEGISEDSEEQADKFLFEALKNLNAATPEGYEAADTLINQAVTAYDVEELTKESANAGKAAIALEYSAAIKFLKNDPSSATIDIERAIALKPRPRSYVFRALINVDRSSFTDANNDFEAAKKLDENFPDIYYHLGQLYYLTGDLVQAEQNFNKARDLNPENVYAYVQLACIKYKSGSPQEAEDMFTAAKLKFPTSPVIPNYYGEILADKKDIEAACKQFDTASRLQKAVSSFSVGALPLINKASILSREGYEHFEEVEKLLTEACELDPKSELARISLAQIKLQNEEVDEAIVLFEESSTLARTIEEKVQATSFAEATKMQKRLKNDPFMTAKIQEAMAQRGM
ncbi:mitochondrial import receptor subunit Tom70p [[Candida] railenensis]|uniref:Mitochondrial import receptor subunit Tom70p n=1 Tax=[Candida] railenensis TaxID=45579 RepID=A0A9P0VWR7_9ASCO|nr:mitochondrial import receptor subunit Tom70p [[Candida] railenensis]